VLGQGPAKVVTIKELKASNAVGHLALRDWRALNGHDIEAPTWLIPPDALAYGPTMSKAEWVAMLHKLKDPDQAAELLKQGEASLAAGLTKTPKPPPVKAAIPPAKPKPAPVPDTVSAPTAPPASPVTAAANLPTGAADLHAGYSWVPDDPPAWLLTEKGGTLEVWGPWLKGQGYTSAEIDTIWNVGAGPSPVPLSASLKKIANDVGGNADDYGNAVAAEVITMLEQAPPGKVVSMAEAPVAFLSPDELGDRLQIATGGTPPGHIAPDAGWHQAVDQIDGTRYLVNTKMAPEQARATVAASRLYRKLGIETPETRLVMQDGRIGVAMRQAHGWQSAQPAELAAKHGKQLSREMPADAWLGNRNVAGGDVPGFYMRSTDTGIGSPVLRARFTGVMEHRADGGSKLFKGDNIAELKGLLDPGINAKTAEIFAEVKGDPSVGFAMVDKIAGLSPADVRQALDASGYSSGEAERLTAVLLERAKTLQKWKSTAVAEAEAARQAAAAAASKVKAARERARLKAMERGEVVLPPVSRGVDLVELAEELEAGPVARAADHGRVRDQSVRLQRYQAERGGKIEHQGYELQAMIDNADAAEVVAKLRAAGAKSGNYRTYTRVGFGQGLDLDSASSPVARYDYSKRSNFLGVGLELDSDTVQIDYASNLVGAEAAMDGRFRIRVKTTTPERAQELLAAELERLGLRHLIDPPDDDAEALLLLNKALWNLEGGKHRRRTDVKAAAADLKALGYDLDDLHKVDLGRGYSTGELRGRWRAMREQNGIRYLYHQGRTDQTALAGMLGHDGGGGGLIATTDRSDLGIVVAGMSSSDDIETGGASSVFTRLVAANSAQRWYHQGTGNYMLHPRALDRTDWYINYHDRYGRFDGLRKGGDAAISELSQPTTDIGHEVMFRHQYRRDDILFVTGRSEGQTRQILSTLKQMGVTTIRGYPVEEMVITMENPHDFSRMNPDNPFHAFVMGLADDVPDIPWEGKP
jgi:hypothetical protein